MTKFLIVQARPEKLAAENELEAFLKFSGLFRAEVDVINASLGQSCSLKNLSKYSGIILGGGPLCVGKKEKTKEKTSLENFLLSILEVVKDKDLPFLGVCLAIGVVGKSTGCKISNDFGEDVGEVEISLTEEGQKDDILTGVPSKFSAFVGHKEACEKLSEEAVLLAGSKTCPIQMFRIKNNIYASQFHPELDHAGLCVRVNIYKNYGYFDPEEAEKLIERNKNADIVHPFKILKNFVKKYKKT
jgi:GMP synthase (glutamine-hydrolysing)